MSSPKPDDIRTEAGQALFHRPLIHTTYCAVKHGKAYRDCICGVTEAILAIEAEAHESGFNEARYAYDENAPEAEAHADTARPSDPDFAAIPDAEWPRANTDQPDTARPVEPPLSSRDEKATNDALLALHNLDTLAASGVNGKGGPPLHDDLKALLSLVAGLCRHALTARPVEPPGVAQETARIGMDLLRDTHDNYATYGAQVAQVVGNAYNEGYKAGQAAAGYGLVERHRTLIRRFSEHLVEGHWAASQLLQEARALLDTEKEDGA